MKLNTFTVTTCIGKFNRLGAEVGGSLIDLNMAGAALYFSRGMSRAYEAANLYIPHDMIDFFKAGKQGLAEAAEAIRFVEKQLADGREVSGPDGEQVIYRFDNIILQSPVLKPNIIFDNMLYENHVRHFRENIPELFYIRPFWNTQCGSTVVGSGAPIIKPHYTNELDFEMELGFFIGKRGKNIPKAEALDHVAGFTIYNDISARDTQRDENKMQLGPAKGKFFENSGIIGPCIVTPDEIGDYANLKMKAYVNGELVAEDTSAGASQSLEEIISFISQDVYLNPGDFIAFGTTPHGTAFCSKLGRYLQIGDIVEFEVENIGRLRNKVIMI